MSNSSAFLADIALACVVSVEAFHDLGAALVGSLQEHINIDSELDGVTGRS